MSAPAEQQVRNKEISIDRDNGEFDQAWTCRCRAGIFIFYIQRFNTNRGAQLRLWTFTMPPRSGGSSGDTPHAVACVLTPTEDIREFHAILAIKGDGDTP